MREGLVGLDRAIRLRWRRRLVLRRNLLGATASMSRGNLVCCRLRSVRCCFFDYISKLGEYTPPAFVSDLRLCCQIGFLRCELDMRRGDQGTGYSYRCSPDCIVFE